MDDWQRVTAPRAKGIAISNPVDIPTVRAINLLRRNVEGLLAKRGYSQATLAFALQCHPTTINKFLRGSREMQLADLDKIADFLGVSTYQLFQPGIVDASERRSGKDRRQNRERRIGPEGRRLEVLRKTVEPARKREYVLTPDQLTLLQQFQDAPLKAQKAITEILNVRLSVKAPEDKKNA